MQNIDIKNQVVNGLYRTSTGKVEVYLGEVEGVKQTKGCGAEKVRGFLYWNVTDRQDKSYIYKKAFAQDLVNYWGNYTENNGSIRILSEPKNNIIEYLGTISDVMRQGLEFQAGSVSIAVKRVKNTN